MKYIRLTLLFILFIIVLDSCATAQQYRKDYAKAEEYTYRGQYQEAEKVYRKLLKKDNSPRPTLALVSLYSEQNKTEKALELLQKQEAKFPKNAAISIWKARLLKNKGEFQAAQKAFLVAQSKVSAEQPKWQNMISESIVELDTILDIIAKPLQIDPQPLDTNINTSADEYLPRYTMDSRMIVFTRRLGQQEDLFWAIRDSNGYNINAIDAVNTLDNEGAQTISGDGRTLILTRCSDRHGLGSCDLYESTYTDGRWSTPKNMGKVINSRYWDAQPSLSNNGQTLYFSSNRPGGKGGSDIWYAEKIKGQWTKPRNMGSPINTAGREESPFIHYDDKTMYFRSTGHAGLGGFDVFWSQREAAEWQGVENFGVPLNTPADDGDLVIDLVGTKAYFSRKTARGDFDIFTFDLPPSRRPQPMTYVKGCVISRLDSQMVKASIRITGLQSQKTVAQTRTQADGCFIIAIPVGEDLSLHATAPRHAIYSSHLAYQTSQYGAKPHQEIIALEPLETPDEMVRSDSLGHDFARHKAIRLNNIFFETGSATLTASSQTEIDLLADFLQYHDSQKIKIIGHTDNIGREEDNLLLSKERAAAVRQALIDKGVSAQRVIAEGRGESQPVTSNETAEGRRLNRRTEFVIL